MFLLQSFAVILRRAMHTPRLDRQRRKCKILEEDSNPYLDDTAAWFTIKSRVVKNIIDLIIRTLRVSLICRAGKCSPRFSCVETEFPLKSLQLPEEV